LWKRSAAAGLSAFSAFVSISCFAQPVFFPVQSTPYDRQMTRVRPVLNSGEATAPRPIPLNAVNDWMTHLRAVPYRFSPFWQTPLEINSMQVADCKGKAVALYAQMRRYGDIKVRVVIGKRHIYDLNTHAWLQWDTNDGSYMLDPTFNEVAVKTSELDPMTYIASYAYAGQERYRATKSGFASANTRVAAGYTTDLHLQTGAGTTFVQSGLTGAGATRFSHPQRSYVTNQAGRAPLPTYSSSVRVAAALVRPVSPVINSNRSAQVAFYRSPVLTQSRLTNQRQLVPTEQSISHATSKSPTYRHVRRLAHRRRHSAHSTRLVSRST
jgi:uncharacterized protein YjfI (DUF2170 family)